MLLRIGDSKRARSDLEWLAHAWLRSPSRPPWRRAGPRGAAARPGAPTSARVAGARAAHARRVFSLAHSVFPRDSRPPCQLGVALAAEGDAVAARRLFAAALELDPGDEQARRAMAMAVPVPVPVAVELTGLAADELLAPAADAHARLRLDGGLDGGLHLSLRGRQTPATLL